MRRVEDAASVVVESPESDPDARVPVADVRNARNQLGVPLADLLQLAEETGRIAKVLEDVQREDEIERALVGQLDRQAGVEIRDDEPVDVVLRSGRRARVDAFFFQAEDGIRYDLVTGVQTCALPISKPKPMQRAAALRKLMRKRVPSRIWICI